MLNSNDWTEAEKWIIKWQFRILGDFHTALFGAIITADEGNLYRLSRGFPAEIEGFRAWAFADPYSLGDKLRKAGLDI